MFAHVEADAICSHQAGQALGDISLPPLFLPDNRPYAFSETS